MKLSNIKTPQRAKTKRGNKLEMDSKSSKFIQIS